MTEEKPAGTTLTKGSRPPSPAVSHIDMTPATQHTERARRFCGSYDLTPVKVTKNKERLGNCSRLRETKEKQEPNAVWDLPVPRNRNSVPVANRELRTRTSSFLKAAARVNIVCCYNVSFLHCYNVTVNDSNLVPMLISWFGSLCYGYLRQGEYMTTQNYFGNFSINLRAVKNIYIFFL